jgi:uncharacterized membrane protein YvlD (DUF360 family)
MILKRLWSLIVIWLATALAVLLCSWIFSSVEVTDFAQALVAALLIGLANALIWPTLIRFALPLTVVTLGLGALVLNGVIVLLVAAIAPGLDVHGLGGGIACALVITAVTTLVSGMLFIDDDVRVAGHLARRAAERRGEVTKTDVPGVLFLEIDGLAHDVLRRAMRDGNAPTLARWVREGTHHLVRWETDWSSQTGACQAGLLHGNNHDMPAFRWWEKDRNAAIVTNHPRDAAELERRVSDGHGLLHADGASRANILSGDAVYSLLTMSRVLDARVRGYGHDYFTYFASPYNTARTLLLSLVEIASELRAAVVQRRRDVRPRIERDWKYALVRAWGTVVQRDIQVESVLGDVYAGRPVVYSTFLAYDEVAHHSGLERADTLAVLRHVDQAIGRIVRAAGNAPRPYEVVVLSDHGQTQGETFLQRYAETLEAVVQRACATDDVRADSSAENEAMGRLEAALTEAGGTSSAGGRAVARVTRGRQVDGEVRLEKQQREKPEKEIPEISVMASGCLGLITFPQIPGRVTNNQLMERYPALVDTLRNHPGIGFLMVDGVVYGPRGTRNVRAGEAAEGEDPLAPYGPNTAEHVKRTDSFPHCPDVVVNSTWWPEIEEVAAFEELVGSHGGLGGPQSYPFVLGPSKLRQPEGMVVGAEGMHRVLRGWLAQLGQDAYR